MRGSNPRADSREVSSYAFYGTLIRGLFPEPQNKALLKLPVP
jgi:hypothetical protein